MALHKDQTGADLHEPKDVAAAVIDQAYVTDGAGSGAMKPFKPNNVVLVNALADFPAPSAGVITLATSTLYALGAPVSTADRFVPSTGSGIVGQSVFTNTLTYTGTGDMFTGTNVNFSMVDCAINCASGTIFNMTRTTGSMTLLFKSVLAISAKKYGTFNDLTVLDIVDSSCLNCEDGLTVTGANWSIFSVTKFALFELLTGKDGIDFGTSVHTTLELADLVLREKAANTATGLKGAAASANVAVNNLATVISGEFSVTTPLSGISTDDIRWEFDRNAGVADSIKAADTFLIATTTVTISTIGVFVAINGTTWSSDIASRFTTTIGGLLTYISEIDSTFIVGGIATIEKTTGGTDVLEMRIAKNGTTLAKSGSFTETTTPATVSSQALVTLTKDDTLQLFVANNTSTGNIDVSVANLTARASG